MFKLVIFTIVAGLVIESHQQGPPCYHPVHIRCWTEWFDRDDPSGSGDWEVLVNLREEFPGKICAKPTGIEVQTLSGQTVQQTGDVIYKMDTVEGFVCRNVDQKKGLCSDYRVRFSCHPPFCGGEVCWTEFFDRDLPSGTGDWEVLKDLQKKFPGKICNKPLYVEGRTSDTNAPADTTGDQLYAFSPTVGLVCRHEDQKNRRCRNYKVRFGCPC
ncbi:unnamed protein product [Ophioblennius macclurei]